jgi:hypothetical protein
MQLLLSEGFAAAVLVIMAKGPMMWLGGAAAGSSVHWLQH